MCTMALPIFIRSAGFGPECANNAAKHTKAMQLQSILHPVKKYEFMYTY